MIRVVGLPVLRAILLLTRRLVGRIASWFTVAARLVIAGLLVARLRTLTFARLRAVAWLLARLTGLALGLLRVAAALACLARALVSRLSAPLVGGLVLPIAAGTFAGRLLSASLLATTGLRAALFATRVAFFPAITRRRGFGLVAFRLLALSIGTFTSLLRVALSFWRTLGLGLTAGTRFAGIVPLLATRRLTRTIGRVLALLAPFTLLVPALVSAPFASACRSAVEPGSPSVACSSNC